MTSEARFRAALARGDLIEWRSGRRGVVNRRVLALSADAHKRAETPWGERNDPLEALRQGMLAAFGRYVADQAPLGLLFAPLSDRYGLAQMKLLAPRPGARLVGAFAAEGAFVGFSLWRRDELPHGPRPGQGLGVSYKDLSQRTLAAWQGVMGEQAAHKPPTVFRRDADD